jgi:hypothetical protein
MFGGFMERPRYVYDNGTSKLTDDGFSSQNIEKQFVKMLLPESSLTL